MIQNTFLIDTDGTWDNTSLLCNGEPLDALRLRIRVKVHRKKDWLGRHHIEDIECEHLLLMADGREIGILPGSVEVSVQGKGFIISNERLSLQEFGGETEVFVEEHTDFFGEVVAETETIVQSHGGEDVVPDPSSFVVSYLNHVDVFADPVVAWCRKHQFVGNNLISVLDEAVIDFNYPEDNWCVAISLFHGKRLGSDEIETIILGASAS